MGRVLFVSPPPAQERRSPHSVPWRRNLTIAVIAFLTLVDLFATQAVLPSLAQHYAVGAAAMGTAVNACTLGMAVSGLAVALASRRIDRRRGIVASLALLSIPTALLAVAPDLPSFTVLRIAQGLFMAAAFTLTLAHLGERCSAVEAAGAFAAYVTGNVASNLFGRILSAALADHLGLATTFLGFAILNLIGAILAFLTLDRAKLPDRGAPPPRSLVSGWRLPLRDPALRAGFAIGFCILFAFIGTFTYVNFVLVDPPHALRPMTLGLVYLVFLPSIVTTPLAGSAVARWGSRPTMWSGLAAAGLGLPMLLAGALAPVLAGLVLVAAGTFLAQATATGFVGRAATADRGTASGLYLASYFAGGLAGSAVLGIVFDRLGWPACVLGIGATLGLAAMLTARLRPPTLSGQGGIDRL